MDELGVVIIGRNEGDRLRRARESVAGGPDRGLRRFQLDRWKPGTGPELCMPSWWNWTSLDRSRLPKPAMRVLSGFFGSLRVFDGSSSLMATAN